MSTRKRTAAEAASGDDEASDLSVDNRQRDYGEGDDTYDDDVVDAEVVDDDDEEGKDDYDLVTGEDGRQNRSRTNKTKRGPTREMADFLVHFKFSHREQTNNKHWCNYCLALYERKLKAWEDGAESVAPPPLETHRQRVVVLKRHLDTCNAYRSHAARQIGMLSYDEQSPSHVAASSTMSRQGMLARKSTSRVGGTPQSHNATATVSSVTIPNHSAFGRRQVAAIPSHGSSLHQYWCPSLTPEEQTKLHTLILEFAVESALPFTVIERRSFMRMVDFLRPGSSASLFKRRTLSDRVLEERYQEAVVRRDAKIQGLHIRGHYIGLLVDGWETNNKHSLEGVMLKSGPLSFLLTSVDPGTDHHAIAVATLWESIIFNNAGAHLNRLRYFLSDDAGQCARARRILALRHPHILWTKCWAHQVNLMVGKLMTRSSFASVSDQAVKAAIAVRSSSSKWYARLRNIAERKYGKRPGNTIFTLAETRWNSLQAVFAAQLRIRGACQLLYFEFNADPKWPPVLDVWKDNQFWMKLEEAELLIRPFCDASFLMQREGMYNVCLPHFQSMVSNNLLYIR